MGTSGLLTIHEGSHAHQRPATHPSRETTTRSLSPRRCRQEDDDDDGGVRKPIRRSHSRDYDYQKSRALAEELQAQEDEQRQRQKQEQEQQDIQLALSILDESVTTGEAHRRDSDFARALLDESRQRHDHQELRDMDYARSLLDESQQRQQHQEFTDNELARLLLDESQQRCEQLDLATAKMLLELDDESCARRRHRSGRAVEVVLRPCQQQAVDYVKERAKELHDQALPLLLNRVSHNLGYTAADLQTCLEYIREDAPIVIHVSEVTLENHLVKDTHYRNLFETNTSGGCKDKAKRLEWETTMFGNCYDDSMSCGEDNTENAETSNTENDCTAFDRPKYGALNVTGDIAGVRSARRYGNCYLTLHEHVRQRATFFDKDSGGFVEERTLATNEHYAHILNEYSDTDLEAAMNVACTNRVGGARSWCSVYKEVQIHGPVSLEHDVQALSVPGREADATPEFRQAVLQFQLKTGCNILWQLDLLDPEES